MHEASLHDENAFITLTYDDDNIPPHGSLDRAAFPLFMKRLRKSIEPRRVRYFHAGEYGENLGRPHYHACLFGFDFSDKYAWSSRNGFPVWRSESLEKLWPFGLSEIGTVTFESAAYVARYITKKVTGEKGGEHYARVDEYSGECYELVREYCTMSRRPGIGDGWIRTFRDEAYPPDDAHAGVVVNGRLCRSPRYYDNFRAREDPDGVARLSAFRAARAVKDSSDDRLKVREKVTLAQFKQLARRLEQ